MTLKCKLLFVNIKYINPVLTSVLFRLRAIVPKTILYFKKQ